MNLINVLDENFTDSEVNEDNRDIQVAGNDSSGSRGDPGPQI